MESLGGTEEPRGSFREALRPGQTGKSHETNRGSVRISHVYQNRETLMQEFSGPLNIALEENHVSQVGKNPPFAPRVSGLPSRFKRFEIKRSGPGEVSTQPQYVGQVVKRGGATGGVIAITEVREAFSKKSVRPLEVARSEGYPTKSM